MASSTGSATSAALTPPRRPWPIWAMTGLLVLLAVFAVVGSLHRHGGVTTPAAVAGVVLVLLGVALVAWRRAGWWLAAVVLGLLLVIQVLAELDEPTSGSAIAIAAEAVLLGLLLLPATRRYRSWSAPRAANLPPEVGTPRGWTREWAGGWVKVVGFVVLALLSLGVGGVGVVHPYSGQDAPSRAAMGAVLAFGIVLAGALPAFWPRHSALPSHRTVQANGRGVTGLAFPYSRARVASQLVTCVGFVAMGLIFLLAPDPDQRHPAVVLRVVGGVSVLLFGFAAVVLGSRVRRRWWLVATPEEIGGVGLPGAGLVPWDAVEDVRASEITTYTQGGATHVRQITVDVSDPSKVRRSRGDVLLPSLVRGGPLVFDTRTLAVEPSLTYEALRFYVDNASARDELGDDRAVARVRSGDLTTAARAGR